MSDSLNERLNKILPRVISDGFLSGSGIGNEVAFYIFDYPPGGQLKVRDYLRTLVEHIPKQKHGLRVKQLNLFDFVVDYLKGRSLLDKAIQGQRCLAAPGSPYRADSCLLGSPPRSRTGSTACWENRHRLRNVLNQGWQLGRTLDGGGDNRICKWQPRCRYRSPSGTSRK